VSLPRPDAHVLWSNVGRFGLRFLDPRGVAPPGTRAAAVLDTVYDRTTGAAFRHLGLSRRLPSVDVMKVGWTDARLPTHEDLATFGPIFGLAGLPLLGLVAFRPRSSPAQRALAVAAGSYLLAVAVLFRYHQATSRYLIAGVALGAPLLAMLYGGRGRAARRIASGVCVGATLATLATCVLYNARKPMVGSAAVWRIRERAQRRRSPARTSTCCCRCSGGSHPACWASCPRARRPSSIRCSANASSSRSASCTPAPSIR
jgi:hypothetical protein